MRFHYKLLCNNSTPLFPLLDPAATLKTKNLDEIINDWASQIEQDLSTFARQATLVAEWDRKVNQNGEKVRIYEAFHEIVH